jgi:hypothetical protein
MTFGEEGKEQARVHDIETVKKILDVFQSHGHNEVSPFAPEIELTDAEPDRLTQHVFTGAERARYTWQR